MRLAGVAVRTAIIPLRLVLLVARPQVQAQAMDTARLIAVAVAAVDIRKLASRLLAATVERASSSFDTRVHAALLVER